MTGDIVRRIDEQDDVMKQKKKQDKVRIPTFTITQLKEMATTRRLRDILVNYIEHEKIPSVRMAWIEYFLDIKNKKISINER